MRPRLPIVVGLVVVVAVAVVGWVVASRIKSPAQIAAEAEPPTPSLITVPVEEIIGFRWQTTKQNSSDWAGWQVAFAVFTGG